MDKGWLDFLKNREKLGIDLQPFEIFETTRSLFHFTLGMGTHLKMFIERL